MSTTEEFTEWGIEVSYEDGSSYYGPSTSEKHAREAAARAGSNTAWPGPISEVHVVARRVTRTPWSRE